jgi:Ferritin-like domain
MAAGGLGAGSAHAQTSEAGQLERLLALERRLEAAYGAALSRDAIDPALGRRLLAHEREHVRGLALSLETLNRRPGDAGAAPPPAAVLGDRRSFARFALRLEEQAVAAYVRVLSTLAAPDLLQPLGSIMASGAQHQVALRDSLGEPLLAR